MPNGRRWNISYPRKFTAGAIIGVGIFVASAGAGLRRWSVVAVGFALIALAISLLVISAVRAGARSFVRGTAHVLDVTDPPANTELGRCELDVVVEAEALTPVKVKIHDERTPVAKWPDIGDTLPVRVAVEDPHHVRILWGEVPTHAERAAEEERFHMHVQRIVEAGLATANGSDQDAETAVPVDETATVPRPRPRPSPRPRRHAGGATRSAVVASAGTSTVPDPEAGVKPGAGEEHEIPVHDVVPIEGASAVLGRPGEGASEISPSADDAAGERPGEDGRRPADS